MCTAAGSNVCAALRLGKPEQSPAPCSPCLDPPQNTPPQGCPRGAWKTCQPVLSAFKKLVQGAAAAVAEALRMTVPCLDCWGLARFVLDASCAHFRGAGGLFSPRIIQSPITFIFGSAGLHICMKTATKQVQMHAAAYSCLLVLRLSEPAAAACAGLTWADCTLYRQLVSARVSTGYTGIHLCPSLACWLTALTMAAYSQPVSEPHPHKIGESNGFLENKESTRALQSLACQSVTRNDRTFCLYH